MGHPQTDKPVSMKCVDSTSDDGTGIRGKFPGEAKT